MQRIPGGVSAAWQCANHDVATGGPREKHFMADGPQPTTNQVACHCATNILADDKANASGVFTEVFMKIENCVRRSNATTSSHRVAKVGWPDNPVRSGEHLLKLRGELGATLAATRTKDCPTRASAHPQSEAVHLGTTTVVWLESSLAHSGISKAQR